MASAVHYLGDEKLARSCSARKESLTSSGESRQRSASVCLQKRGQDHTHTHTQAFSPHPSRAVQPLTSRSPRQGVQSSMALAAGAPAWVHTPAHAPPSQTHLSPSFYPAPRQGEVRMQGSSRRSTPLGSTLCPCPCITSSTPPTRAHTSATRSWVRRREPVHGCHFHSPVRHSPQHSTMMDQSHTKHSCAVSVPQGSQVL